MDGRKADRQLDLVSARDFCRMPDEFFRPNASYILGDGAGTFFATYPVKPGGNNGKVNTYGPDPNSARLGDFCKLYHNYVNITIKALYPNPKGVLKSALKVNLRSFFKRVTGFLADPSSCFELFPYGE